MKYAKFEYGAVVAFFEKKTVCFGVIEEIICRQNASGEVVEYAITHPDGQSIQREDMIAEIDDVTAYTGFDKLMKLCPARQWAIEASVRMLAPKPEPACDIPFELPAQAPVPLVSDGTEPMTRGMADVPITSD